MSVRSDTDSPGPNRTSGVTASDTGRHPFKYLLGTAFGSGLLPVVPGTWASLSVLIPAWFLTEVDILFALIGLLVFSLLTGFYSAGWFESKFGKDPSIFVMDEWAGQILPLFALFAWPEASGQEKFLIFLIAFLLFRFFDILKPLGIDRIQRFSGAAGIMLDDILAGIYALCTLFFAIFVYLNLF